MANIPFFSKLFKDYSLLHPYLFMICSCFNAIPRSKKWGHIVLRMSVCLPVRLSENQMWSACYLKNILSRNFHKYASWMVLVRKWPKVTIIMFVKSNEKKGLRAYIETCLDFIFHMMIGLCNDMIPFGCMFTCQGHKGHYSKNVKRLSLFFLKTIA